MTIRTWNFDAAHSSILFVARHMVVARVYGRFNQFTGTLQVDPDNVTTGSVEVEIKAASVDTNAPDRDNHLRSPDFLDAAQFPVIGFKSLRVEDGGAGMRVHGELTIRGITKPAVLETRKLGTMTDPWGQQRVLFNARTTVARADYGVNWNKALTNGGWLVGEKVDIELDVQAVERK